MDRLALMVIMIILTTFSYGQKIGVGASGMYNFQSEGFGAGARHLCVNYSPGREALHHWTISDRLSSRYGCRFR